MLTSSLAIAENAPSAATATPIKHIVVLLMENHTFDNMFGVYPGLKSPYRLPLSVCVPNQSGNPSAGCTKPWNADSKASEVQGTGLCHSGDCQTTAYDGGKMDGFVYAQIGVSSTPNDTMAYYTGTTIPDYWDLASYYTLDANFFSSTLQYSWPNHVYALAGQGDGCADPCHPNFDLTFQTMAGVLTSAGISWGYFSGDWQDSFDCTPVTVQGGLPYIGATQIPKFLSFWQVAMDFPALQDSAPNCNSMGTLTDLSNDIASNSLPAVSWVTPSQCCSDHPGNATTWTTGQEFVAGVLDAIGSSPLWKSTAIFLAYDDGGGYYDSVVPKQVDHYGYGFRVPLIVISPYVKATIRYGPGYRQQDFTAFLATIERNWGITPFGTRDASVGDLFYLFNFRQRPRPALILPTHSVASYPLSACALCQYGAAQPIPFTPPVSVNAPCLPNQVADPCD
jgi:phospholipase C